MPDRPTLETAADAAAILEALARATWAKAHDRAECPDKRIPAPADLAAWLPECPDDVLQDASELLRDVYGTPARWELVRGADGNPATLSAAVTVAIPAALRARLGDSTTALRPLINAHEAWRDVDPRPRHPLAPIVDAWQRLAPVPVEWDSRPHPVLPGTLAGRAGGLRPLVTADQRHLPFALGGGEAPKQLWLGFAHAGPEQVPVLPLVSWDRRGGVSMTRGPGAAHAVRLYVEALLAVPPELRRVGFGAPAALHCTLRELVAGLWPRGWNRGRDWPRLMAGLDELRRLGVEWQHADTGGVWYSVTVRTEPRDGASLDDLVVFEVLLPPGSGPGPLVSRHHLRLLGLDSAPAYRLYLSLCWLWDHYGTRRGRLIGADVPTSSKRRQRRVEPVRIDGRLINPAALHWYPALSPDDLAIMSYAPADLAPGGSTRRTQRQRAREALDRIVRQTGAVLAHTARTDGARGCVRVLPPADHKAAHDGKAEQWRRERPGPDQGGTIT